MYQREKEKVYETHSRSWSRESLTWYSFIGPEENQVSTELVLFYHGTYLFLSFLPVKWFEFDWVTPVIQTVGKDIAAAAAKSLQSWPTLCDPIDGSPPGSPIPEILQARTLEWVAISLFNAWKWKVKGKSLSRVRLLATPWTAAYQAPPSTGFSRQEYYSGVPLPLPNLVGKRGRISFEIS